MKNITCISLSTLKYFTREFCLDEKEYYCFMDRHSARLLISYITEAITTSTIGFSYQ